MKVGLVCGSLAAQSANAETLRVAGRRLNERGHEIQFVGSVAAIPAFDPALVDEAPEAVQAFRNDLRACDAVLIAAPEYAAGVAGSTKNALDWLVGDATIYHKVVGVASAGTTGGPFAIEQLVRTISWQGGLVVATLGIASPRTKADASGTYTDAATLVEISSWADAVAEAVQASPTRRREMLAAALAPFDIDPTRFGDLT